METALGKGLRPGVGPLSKGEIAVEVIGEAGCVCVQLLVLANSAQKLLLDPSPTPRTIHYRGLLHDSSPDCSLCASCWSISGGWRKTHVAIVHTCMCFSHNGTISSAGFCL